MKSHTVSGVQGHSNRISQKAFVGELYDMNDLFIEFMCCSRVSGSKNLQNC